MTVRDQKGSVVNQSHTVKTNKPPIQSRQGAPPKPPQAKSNPQNLNSDLTEFEDPSLTEPTYASNLDLDKQELFMLRKENTDLNEMVDSYKVKIKEKTVEVNRLKKKL